MSLVGLRLGKQTRLERGGMIPSPVTTSQKVSSLMSAKPLVKWAGGKTQLLSELQTRMPAEFGAYHEPFFGGGALFFYLAPSRASLSDMNSDLISLYETTRDNVDALEASLESISNEFNQLDESGKSAFYYEQRVRYNTRSDDKITSATLFLFLNKAGFNGLYRENARGAFNVPFGNRKSVTLFDAENLRKTSRLLQDVDLQVSGFEAVEERVAPGDFVYFDPPYVPLEGSASFTKYQASDFGPAEQSKLAELTKRLTAKGVKVMLSNSHTPSVVKLYEEFSIDVVHAKRNINSNGAKRGDVEEVIIRNFESQELNEIS
jgi:DNA adenine methylase